MSQKFTPARVETAFWLAICAGLVISVGVDTDWGRQIRLPARKIADLPGTFKAPELTEPYSLPGADTMLETTLRPLFIVTRRPAPTADISKPAMNKGQFVLTGVSILPQVKYAFLLEKAGNRSPTRSCSLRTTTARSCR